MKFSLIIIALIVLISFTTATNEEMRKKECDKTCVESRNVDWMKAFNAHDAEKLGTFYTEDAQILPPGTDQAIVGREAIIGMWKGVFEVGGDHSTLSIVDVDSPAKSTGIENGRFELFAADNTMLDSGKYVIVWKLIKGECYISLDIFNSNNQ